MADDVAAVMDAVEMPSAHVHGTSMGGLIAQDLAIRYPERVLSVVLGATYAGGPPLSRAVRLLPLLLSEKGAGRSPARDGAVPVSDADPGNS
jgi:pimeloyl-ACP methyl ester carboxylesterase